MVYVILFSTLLMVAVAIYFYMANIGETYDQGFNDINKDYLTEFSDEEDLKVNEKNKTIKDD